MPNWIDFCRSCCALSFGSFRFAFQLFASMQSQILYPKSIRGLARERAFSNAYAICGTCPRESGLHFSGYICISVCAGISISMVLVSEVLLPLHSPSSSLDLFFSRSCCALLFWFFPFRFSYIGLEHIKSLSKLSTRHKIAM